MEVPKELVEKVYKVISSAKVDGKIRRGANETTKSLERGEAKLVVYAGDVSPSEITLHFSMLAKEKDIPHISVPSKTELGAAAGLPVSTAAVAIVNPGEAKKLLEEIVKNLKTLSTVKAAPKVEKKEEKPAEEKKEEKVEAPKEEKPEEKKEENQKVEEKPIEKEEESEKEEKSK